MIISLLVVIGALALMFKLTGLIFGVFGKLLGLIFSGIGYFFLGVLAVGAFGIALFVVPIIIIAGIIAIIGGLAD